MPLFHRITLFKIPSESDIDAVLHSYDILKETNRKDQKPYIISCTASRVVNTSESRSQGYTVAVQSTFASKADVDFYDHDCPAHKELKKVTTPAHQGICTLIMEGSEEGS